jgi:hypothetical protein
MKTQIRETAKDIAYSFDAISTPETSTTLGSLLNPDTEKLSVVLCKNAELDIPNGVERFGLWRLGYGNLFSLIRKREKRG